MAQPKDCVTDLVYVLLPRKANTPSYAPAFPLTPRASTTTIRPWPRHRRQNRRAGAATFCKPYSERVPTVTALQPESKGRTRERFDPETGLQYLNIRTYHPKLGMFIQPDWWEVTKPGVGTNRYGYSFGDLVHKMDPKGNSCTGQGGGHCGRNSEYLELFEDKDLSNKTSFPHAAASVRGLLATWTAADPPDAGTEHPIPPIYPSETIQQK